MTRLRMERLLLALAIVAVTSCSSDSPQATLGAPRWEAVETLRIGDSDTTALTYFRELRVGRDGRSFSFHRPERLLRIHSSSGELLAEVGGEGDGPGEFQGSAAIGLVGDTLWALDYSLYRVTYFDPDGDIVRTQRFPIELGRGGPDDPPRPQGILSDGSILGAPPAWSREVAAGTLSEGHYLHMDSAGQVLDTIASYPLTNSVLEIADPENRSSFGSYSPQPFNDSEIVEVSPYGREVLRVDRTVAPGRAEFRVTLMTFDDDTIFSAAHSYHPVPIEPALVDSIIDALAARFEDSPFPRAPTPARAAEWAADAIYVPIHHPPVSAAKLGRDGTVWLKGIDTGTGTVTWTCLGRSGQVLGVVDLPPSFTLMEAEQGQVWGMWQDEFDVPHILRYELRDPPAS